jgi:ABC-type transporter Mla MlaB component
MIVSSSQSNSLTLAVSGKVNADSLPEIGRFIESGQRNQQQVVLDLSEVTLLDRAAARFFGETLKRGVELVNCPRYIRHWISPEITHEPED